MFSSKGIYGKFKHDFSSGSVNIYIYIYTNYWYDICWSVLWVRRMILYSLVLAEWYACMACSPTLESPTIQVINSATRQMMWLLKTYPKVAFLLFRQWNYCRSFKLTIGGGFKYFLCSPLLGEMIQFDSYFIKWVVQPPPRMELLKQMQLFFQGILVYVGFRFDVIFGFLSWRKPFGNLEGPRS